ncbi:MAG TPA: hypothetical protein VES93_14225 [Ornithinibacter sp.]|nr:hypothetical protein [Ornithinibacter sp.]
MRPTRTVSILAALSLMALAGCSDDGPPDPSPSPSASSASPSPSPTAGSPSTSPTNSPTVRPSVPSGFSLDDVSSPGFPNLGGDLGGIGVVRVGRHAGYDRVVWQFPGSGRPTYQVRYVDEPTADGSGDVVDVRGAAYLEVLITTVGIPAPGTPPPEDASASSIAGTVIEQAMPVYGGFEGYGQSFVGVRDRQRPFKVTVLTSPTRLVVDVYSG